MSWPGLVTRSLHPGSGVHICPAQRWWVVMGLRRGSWTVGSEWRLVPRLLSTWVPSKEVRSNLHKAVLQGLYRPGGGRCLAQASRLSERPGEVNESCFPVRPSGYLSPSEGCVWRRSGKTQDWRPPEREGLCRGWWGELFCAPAGVESPALEERQSGWGLDAWSSLPCLSQGGEHGKEERPRKSCTAGHASACHRL